MLLSGPHELVLNWNFDVEIRQPLSTRMLGNGHVIPGTPIAVDMWNPKNYPQARIFFLSHFHADHLVGLTSSWQFPIYASPLTCKLLIHKIKVKPSLVKCLEIGEDQFIPLDLEGKELLTVTLFDANHCPGSVMFLFSGYFGNIFYTGDFRYKAGILEDFQLPEIDVLYLDNTYCSPKCLFPTRENAIEKILLQLSDCLMNSNRVYIGLDNLGKEDLLQQIVKERRAKVFVNPARKEIMDILGFSDIVTSNEDETNVFVVPTNQINGRNRDKWNKDKKAHAILATARFSGFEFQPYSKYSDIHVIPYSNHSSYLELKEFVKLVQPSSIIPVVNKNAKGIFNTDISDRANMSVFKRFLSNTKPFDFTIPESVKKSMAASEVSNVVSLPLKKRKVARPIKRPFKKPPPAAGIRYIVSEDSETDSDPDAVHIEVDEVDSTTSKKLKIVSEDISDFSSPLSEEDSGESDDAWEVTLVTCKGVQNVSPVQK
ncbi:5' exonuclease Apollo isoform X2 [Parasteatoda tepidariorum]|uniref:5' exonuclease Apollo isoform X2 n=1 Tax=Parasteatoda tepidariorum TaxID=114398 RepID=UPI0039BC917C